MYLHDYYYAYQSGGLNCDISESFSTCANAWIFLGNNDTGNTSTYEWTMTRYGYVGSGYYAWMVSFTGPIYNTVLTDAYVVRPVFFLTSDVNYLSGSGTLSDPILIS